MTKFTSTELNKKIDKVKAKMFLYKDGAFLASLLCSTKITIKDIDKIACTNGIEIILSTKYIEELSEDYLITVLTHELWHIARMHNLREGKRNHEYWNIATDIVINNALIEDGYKGTVELDGIHDLSYRGMSEEEVYAEILEEPPCWHNEEQLDLVFPDPNDSSSPFESKNEPRTSIELQQRLNIQKAIAITKDCSSQAVDEIKQLLDDQLAPKVNWKKAVKLFMLDAMSEESSWSRRSRRYPDIYMPGKIKEEDKLTHLAFFIDTSGSITEDEIQQIQAELRNIHKELKPSKMTLVQFDYKIQHEDVIYEDTKWEPLTIYGFGGTSLEPVHDWIRKNKPTATVIFSDLYCDPMEYVKTPILWIIVNNEYTPTFGKSIHIKV